MSVPIDTFSNRLNKAMQIRNIKPIELSEKTKIDKSKISSYMSGRYKAKQDGIYSISLALSINPAWLMGYDVPMNSSEWGLDNVEYKNLKSLNTITNNIIKVPIYGVIPAGIPIEAIEDIVDYEELSIKKDDVSIYFGLQIKGNSMFPEYKDKDNIIFIKQDNCESGQDCAILVNGDDCTFKKVIKKENGIWLQPINPSFEPVFYSNEDIQEKPVKILGIAKEIRRKLN